eukprot:TRINITY_DN8233_c0_g1_i1.p1 TRINITY_DN8233_c0_g1~~TRINITY_DN8233_c0_g1_i1.p1  ORF type:complete len:555 (-),score=92.02 TRINITY_DN8233_c0_g1_i1:191-1855(-)
MVDDHGTKVGTIKDIGKNHAFIDCPEVKEETGMDTFCPAKYLPGLKVGAEIEFELMFNDKGQPQASNPRRHVSQALETRIGVIKDIGKNHAFIDCPEVKDETGMDTFCPAKYLPGFKNGALIEFEVMFNDKGQPQASNPRQHVSPAPETKVGIIKDIGINHAFIDCPEVKEETGMDTFCPAKYLPGLKAGAEIEFELMFNDKGQPQASNPRQHVSPAPETKFGTIKDIGKNHAFIDCPPVKAKTGMDTFCPAKYLVGATVGDRIEFELTFNDKGQPQARNARSKGSGKHAKAGFAASTVRLDGQQFGTILEIGKHLAFIDCPPLKAATGMDVYCPSWSLAGASVGQLVEFDLMFNDKGQPQASNPRLKSSGKGSNAGKVLKTAAVKYPIAGSKFGTIMEIGKMLAYIDCPPVKAETGMDTYCPSRLLAGINVGELVEFELMFNDKGQPQASNPRPKGSSKGNHAVKYPSEGRKFGTITDIGKKLVFIDCPPVKAETGLDVFCPSWSLAGMNIGDRVEFDLMFNDKGQPQAGNPRLKGVGKGNVAAGYKRKREWN